MNIDRHKRIATGRDGGKEQLEEAFRRIGHPNVRLEAFELGDWLADVSQFVDPVATDPRAMIEGVSDAARAIVELLAEHAPGAIRQQLTELIVPPISRVVGQIHGAIRDVFGTAPGDARNAAYAAHLRDIFRVAGYFRFVHSPPGRTPKMDFEAYKGVFDGVPGRFEPQFSQYYPFEHLDRPNVPATADPPNYDMRRNASSGMYTYLSEGIEICAGSLAELDRDWATPQFAGTTAPDDTDLQWNVNLARLGRTMHMVEDFFAHSTFVEHAAAIDQRYARRQTRGWNTSDIYRRRLRRYVPNEPDSRLAEPFIVTGYFDKQDTLVSLSHGLEDVFGARFTDPERALRTGRAAISDPRRFFSDFGEEVFFEFGELVTHPKLAMRDPDNALAQYLHGQYPDLVAVIERLASDPAAYSQSLDPRRQVTDEVIDVLTSDGALWRDVPPEVKGWFVDSVRWLGEVRQAAGAVYNVYQIVQTVAAIYSSLERAAKVLKVWFSLPSAPGARGGPSTRGARGWQRIVAMVVRLVAGAAVNAIELALLMSVLLASQLPEIIRGAAAAVGASVDYYARELLYRAIGARRVGSHSLLAKDYDDSDPFADQALHLARGAHRYIVHVLVRNHLSEQPGPQRPVDWLELTNHFLAHPRISPQWWRPILLRNGLRTRAGVLPVALDHTLRATDARGRDALIDRAGRLREAATSAYSLAPVP